jgi:DNA-binding NarL/FixJ family response regulator
MAVHVLIVDADVSAAAITNAIVKRIDPEAIVTCERSPDRGWLQLQQALPNVLIIDPTAYGSGSMLLIQLCQEEHPALQIVVLASAPTPALRAAARRLGIAVYVEKPVTLAILADKLRPLLRGYEPVAQVAAVPHIQRR